MNKKRRPLSPFMMEGTFFYKKKCFLCPSRTFKLVYSPGKKEYLFYVPPAVIDLKREKLHLFFKYWESRIKKKKMSLCLKKEVRRLLASLRPRGDTPRQASHYDLRPQGKYHDLQHHFQNVCQALDLPGNEYIRLGWSKKPVKSYWGKYLPAIEGIIINRFLDSSRCPPYILEYILYHELLHHLIKPDFEEAHYRHSSLFRYYMRKFPDERRIRKELKELASLLSRKYKTVCP